MHTRPDGEKKAGHGDGGSEPERPKASWPELEVKPGNWDASRREEDDRDQDGRRRRMPEAAGSRRWVVLVSAALIRQ